MIRSIGSIVAALCLFVTGALAQNVSSAPAPMVPIAPPAFSPNAIIFTALNINFNATGDTAIPISLPPGFTRYKQNTILISGASASLSSSSVGVWTATAEGGTPIVSAVTPTITTASDGTINNLMSLTIVNLNTASYTLSGFPTLYFHVATAQGSAATASVTVSVVPLP